MQLELNKTQYIDALSGLRALPDNSIHCCVTSPPYWGLRDYGIEGQLGLEKTPEEYIENIRLIFSEVRRVLRNDGTLWLNLGDSYQGSGNAMGQKDQNNLGRIPSKYGATKGHTLKKHSKLKSKDLIGIPWMVAFALRDDGWYLRQDTIWSKPAPMPESVQDRCTKSHEYLFLLTKSKKYWYDAEAIKTEMKNISIARAKRGLSETNKWNNGAPNSTVHSISGPRENINIFPGGKRKPRNGIDVKGGNQANENGIPFNFKMAVPTGWDTEKRSHGKFHQEGRRKSFTKLQGGGGTGLKGHSGNYDAAGRIIGNGKANKKSVWTIEDNLSTLQWLSLNFPDVFAQYIEQSANKNSVWTVNTKGLKEAHFATYPQELIIDCIKAGCPEFVCSQCGSPYWPEVERKLVASSKACKKTVIDKRDITADKNDQGSNRQKDGNKPGMAYQTVNKKFIKKCNCEAPVANGIVLDPFSGSGTTKIVSRKQNRNYLGFELNPGYLEIEEKRTYAELGMFQ